MGRHDVLPQLPGPHLSIPKPPHGGNGLGIVGANIQELMTYLFTLGAALG